MMVTMIGKWIMMLMLMTMASPLALATSAALLRPAQALVDGQQQEIWLQADVFDQNFDLWGYADKLGGSAKTDHLQMLRLGSNYRLNNHWTLRAEALSGTQTIVRSLAPKRLNPSFHGLTIMAQWQASDWPLRLEGGISLHRIASEGFSIYQTNTTTIIAPPGKQLASSSAHDQGFFLRAAYPWQHGAWHYHLGSTIHYQTIQAQYTINDPAISPFVGNQIPQSTPWQEYQLSLFLSVDYHYNRHWDIGADFYHHQIKRNQYLTGNNPDYNNSEQLDVWLKWSASKNVSIAMRGHANNHFMLGEIPAFYHRGISHKFRYPFGFLSLAIILQR